MDINDIAARITATLTLIRQCREDLKARREAWIDAEDVYRKTLAVTLLKLKNGAYGEYEGLSTEKIPASSQMLVDVAKSICSEEKIARDLAKLAYKDMYKGIEMLLSELSAWQSLYRHQDRE